MAARTSSLVYENSGGPRESPRQGPTRGRAAEPLDERLAEGREPELVVVFLHPFNSGAGLCTCLNNEGCQPAIKGPLALA